MSQKKKGGQRLLKDPKRSEEEKKPKEVPFTSGGGETKGTLGPEEPKKPMPETGSSGADAGSGEGSRPERSTLKKVLRIGYIALTVISGIIVAVGIFIMNFVQKPVQMEQPARPPVAPMVSESLAPGETPHQQAHGNAHGSAVSSDRKEDFYTFLVVGRDTYGGGNTDTILLASYDIPNQALSVMSIPRDTLVNVSWDIKKINSVYNVYGGGDKGMDALKEEISQLVGFRPDYTFVVEWEAIGELVDAIGGVYFTVPRRMYYNDLSQNFRIDLQKGYQKLSGSQAMQLLRYRHDSDDSGNILNSGYADGDLGRIKVQQDFLKATIEQCLANITDLKTITALAQVFFDNVTTPLSVGNLAWFAQQAVFGNADGVRLDMANVRFMTMPWVSADRVWSRTYGNHPSYVAPNVDEVVDVVNQRFNPYKDDLRQDELDIMYVNKDGTLGCTGGRLEDTRYNSWLLNGGGYSGSSSPEPSGSSEPTDEPSPSPDPSDEPTDSPGEPTDEPTDEPDDPSDDPSEEPSTSPAQPPDPSESTEPTSSQPPEGEPSPSVSQAPTPSASPSADPSPEPSEPIPTPEPTPSNGPPEGLPVIPQG